MSLYSAAGNGATILTNPDAPLNLANNPQVTSGSTIGLVWNEGAEDGGTVVIDYQVSYDQGQGTEEYVLLEAGITSLSYSATGVVSGTSYKFKVQARNDFGLSGYSVAVTILAAQTPNQPDAPVTSVSTSNIVISWTAPYDNGSPILSYDVLIRKSDGATFALDTANCDGSNTVIRDAQ